MSDAVLTVIIAGVANVVISAFGLLALWLKMAMEGRKTEAVDRKAVLAANKANIAKEAAVETAGKVDALAVQLAENTQLTAKVDQQTNGNLDAFRTRVQALEAELRSSRDALSALTENSHKLKRELTDVVGELTRKVEQLLLSRKSTHPDRHNPQG